MKKFKSSKKVLAWLLTLSLVIGLIPGTAWNAFAEDDNTDYLFFATDRHANTSVIGNIINNMESAIGENELDYLGLGGDMVGSGGNHPAYNSSTVLSEVTGATSSLSATNVDIVAGIHDMNVTDDAGIVLPYQGGGAQIYEGANYYVYGVEEYCISDDSNESNWKAQSEAFVTWANGDSIDKSKAIFVLSHYPLHEKRNDNDGAYYWHKALNEVATGSETGKEVVRNVAFFHGHNHTVDSNEYVYNVGDTMSIQNGSSTTSDTIYYTYATAGYLNQNSKATLVTLTDDTITLAKYSTSGSGTAMTTVERVSEEVTLSSISISGTTEYYVGDELDLTVTATYSDGSTKDVTTEAKISGYDMSIAGTQTVTATYGEKTATFEITVTEVEINSIAVTTQPTKLTYAKGEELDTTGMVVTATYNNGTTAEVTDWYTSAVDMTTAGEKTVTVNYAVDGITYKTTFTIEVEEGPAADAVLEKIKITKEPEKIEYLLSQELKLDGMTVEATFSDGTAAELEYKPFSTSTIYGGYELDNFSMYVEKNHEVVITYTYKDVTCTDTFHINVWDESFTDEETKVKVQVTDDYGVTAASVANSTNTNVAKAIADVITGSNYIAYDISLIFDEEYSTTNAKKIVTLPIPEGVSNPVVYYVSDDGKTVTNMNAVKDGNGNVTFNTTHFSTYVIGENIEITVPESVTQSGTVTTGGKETKDVYMLTSSISTGNEYLIVDTNAAGDANILARNGSSVSNTTGTVVNDSNGTYIVLDDASDELWTYDSVSSGWNTINTFKNGSYYLYYTGTNRTLTLTTSTPERSWSYSNNQLTIRNRYLTGGSSWSLSSSSDNVYFYVKDTIEVDTTTTVTGTYKIETEDLSVAASEGSTANLTSTLTFTPESGTATTEDVSTTATYEIVTVDANGNTVDGDYNDVISKIENGVVTFTGNYGKALVKVSYTTAFGVVTDYITVEATAPYYTIQLHEVELEEATGVTADNFANGAYYTYDSTTGFYSVATEYEEGTTYYINNAKQGAEITETIALKGVKEGATYSVWAVVKEHNSDNPDGVDIGELGDALDWTVSDPSIATIDTDTGVITFTGKNYGTFTVTVAYEGADGKVITDTITISVTESLYVVPGDGTNDFPEYPNEGAVRFDKNATAVGNFSETGIAKVELSMTGVPYTTNNAMDVMVMLDMTGSMSDDGMTAAEEATKAFVEKIVKNEDGTYNKNRVAVYAFNSGSSSPYELVSLKTINSDDELSTVNTAIATASDKQASGGTPFDEAAETCYTVLNAAKTTNLPEEIESAEDYNRQQFCVFMSDGGPTTYYGSDEKTYYGGNNNSGDVLLTSCMTGYSSSDSSDWSFTLPTEYYTDLMKNDGVTVYTVGLLLQNAPSNPAPYSSMTDSTYDSTTDSLTTIGSHYYFCSSILKQMASDESKYIDIFNVDNADNATAKFTSIAQSILEAATDVVVEDKIGSNYTVNFALPEGITSTATDGVQDFYIQVVDYALDATTHERTGEYTVKENFTFDGETGELKSHTVGGTVCSNCSHVTTTTDGVITKIEGTYFSYEVKNDGEYLIWNEEKLTSTELALQYFAYLDNSAGTDVEEQIAAGTYYTNEYATLTYTNVNGNDVQQEFPKPQMTWNGAQVSYVFYLVNEAGQPVNRAGRVVPFTEAVYVTDVYTEAVVWNKMEQAAGLEAKYLAEDLVPDVYALYDDDASYNIHVYEDETEVNLNNHFVVGGDVADDYNTTTNSWKNADTTYVFNNKSDATKYNTFGTYVADDGDTDLDETGLSYFCKSATIEGATYTTSEENGVTIYTVKLPEGVQYETVEGETQATVTQIQEAGGSITGGTVIGDYIYYVDENGDVYTIVTKTDGKEVDKGFDFANTTVAFAVVWKPQLEPDTVVVDYGLDVVVDVINNDAMAAGVTGVMATAPDVEIDGTYTTSKGVTSFTSGTGLWTASKENLTSVRFKQNEIGLKEPVTFYYEAGVNYYTYDEEDNATLNTRNMYSSVTVIPATTVYYEDNFVDYTNYTWDYGNNKWAENESDDKTHQWITAGTKTNAVQDTDRPGFNNPVMADSYDAENVYGYDSAYDNMSTYSMGSAQKINVDYDNYGEASFEFFGTGFDVISMTSNTTGFMVVDVYPWDSTAGKYSDETTVSYAVDTYYGYAREYYKIEYIYSEKDGWSSTETKVDALGDSETAPENPVEGDAYTVYTTKWIPVDSNDPNALYQVPVMKVKDLTYGKYKAVIQAQYRPLFDHNQYEQTEIGGSYDFYLDAIRIYDPAGTTDTELGSIVKDAYVADREYKPTYHELRDWIIDAKTFDSLTTDTISGAAFIDSTNESGAGLTNSISDYQNIGPNNELYLAPGQAVTFKLNAGVEAPTGYEVDTVQIALKTVGGKGYSKIWDADTVNINDASPKEISTATDMYYDITSLDNKNVVIMNAGANATSNEDGSTTPADAILSITNVKITYKEKADTLSAISVASVEDTTMPMLFSVSRASVDAALASIDPVIEEPEEPETPVVPDVPVTPEEPEVPVVPDTPVTPEEPEVPPIVDEPEELVVTPAKIISVKTDKKTYVQGDKVKITVTTNSAATKVKVGTKTLKTFKAVKGNRTWTTTIKASKLGKLTINAVAYNSKGTATKKVTKTVTVKKFAPKVFKVNLNKTKVKVGAKYTVTVKAGSTVKHIRVNGKKITKFTTKNGVKTFKVTLKATKVGKQKVKVVAYNKALYPTNPKFKTVTVKRK